MKKFNRGINMKKIFIILTLILILVFGGCKGGSKNNSYSSSKTSSYKSQTSVIKSSNVNSKSNDEQWGKDHII